MSQLYLAPWLLFPSSLGQTACWKQSFHYRSYDLLLLFMIICTWTTNQKTSPNVLWKFWMFCMFYVTFYMANTITKVLFYGQVCFSVKVCLAMTSCVDSQSLTFFFKNSLFFSFIIFNFPTIILLYFFRPPFTLSYVAIFPCLFPWCDGYFEADDSSVLSPMSSCVDMYKRMYVACNWTFLVFMEQVEPTWNTVYQTMNLDPPSAMFTIYVHTSLCSPLITMTFKLRVFHSSVIIFTYSQTSMYISLFKKKKKSNACINWMHKLKFAHALWQKISS